MPQSTIAYGAFVEVGCLTPARLLLTGEEGLFCERCGQHFKPKQSVCTRCGVAASRYWLQLVSLVALLVAVSCNLLVAWLLLPRLVTGHPVGRVFRAWLWLDERASLYGWVLVAVGLLAWDYFIWRASKPKVKRWVTRKLLTFVLVAGIAPILPWWVPAGQPPEGFSATIRQYPGLSSTLAWGAVAFAASLLCINAETRDSLLGHGRVLSLVSLGALLMVSAMTLVGWSITCR